MFEKDSRTVKNNPKQLQKNVFLLYSPRKFTIEPASNKKIDTEVTAFLPRNSKGDITSKFRTNEINEIYYGHHRWWLQIINKPFEDKIKIKKEQRIGFFVVEPEKLKFQQVPCKTKAKKEKKSYMPKNNKAD